MAAIASISPWIPEDDLLLKNAIEAGASFKALAKGAVRFSRKFSVEELRDRWRSLLYDPEVAAEASARMAEVELSASNNNNLSKLSRYGNSKETAELPVKRKAESIRKQYNALRKRIRSQPVDMTFIAEQNGNDCIVDQDGCRKLVAHGNELLVGNHILGDCVLNHFEFQETGINGSHHIYPHVSRDIATTNISNRAHTIDPNSIVDRNPNRVVRESGDNGLSEKTGSFSVEKSIKDEGAHSLEHNNRNRDTSVDLGNHSNVEEMGMSHELQDNNASFQSMGASSPLPCMPLWKTIEDVSAPAMPINVSPGDINRGAEESLMLPDDVDDSLLDFTNEGELLFMDVDAKDAMDKSCYDSLNSLILNSPNDVPEDVVPDVCENPTLVSTTSPSIPDGASEGTADLPGPLQNDQHHICSSDVSVPSSTSLENPCSPKLDDEITICTLNTEDPEIPDNDNFISPVPLASPVIQPINKQAGSVLPSFVDKRNTEPEVSLMNKEKRPVHSFTASPMFGPDMLAETRSDHPPVCGVNAQFPDGNCCYVVSRPGNDTDLSQCMPLHVTPNSANDLAPKEKALHPCNATHVPHADPGSTFKDFPEHEAIASTSDQKESESDDDIPYYSDIEAMILDMDLCPDDQDSCIGRKVSRYLHEDKRTFIRLEQSSRSSKQREIASKGALALLYGHQLRHYIKKTEVILGRATEDIDVDIDLRREGPANKISRRQALIKMEEDGTFILKNLGKGSIFLNGKEVATGQHLSLTSNSFIEVRDMGFVFEINHKYVRQYVANVAKRSRENDTTFAWLPEGGPE